jgi:hypothetical protein
LSVVSRRAGDVPTEPVVNEFESQSALWKKLKDHAAERIALLRARNDSDKDEVSTARLRGRIAELKVFMSLDRPMPGTSSED